MSIFARPVSEAYYPSTGNQILDVESDAHYEAWGYRIAYEVDRDGNDVPYWGNTAILRISEGGVTEPVLVTKPEHHASFTVSVLAGQGMLIRALASGATQAIELQEGSEVTIDPGQAYSYVNTGRKDLLLHDVAVPAFRPGDEIELTKSALRPDGDRRQPPAASYVYVKTAGEAQKCITLPTKFFDLLREAMTGRISSRTREVSA